MDAATAYIYLFPNSQDEDSTTHGIVENKLVYKNSGSRKVYSAPADWTIYMALNIGNINGYINVMSSIVDYEESDYELFYNEWLPTSNYFMTREDKERIQG